MKIKTQNKTKTNSKTKETNIPANKQTKQNKTKLVIIKRIVLWEVDSEQIKFP